MNRIFTHIKTLLSALLLCAFSSMAQDVLWLSGNQVIDFNDPSNISVFDLPSPNLSISDPNYLNSYNGQQVTRSGNVQYDAQGGILFFVVDGIVYDGDGYKMGEIDMLGSPTPAQGATCIVKGKDSCTRYYIFTHGSNQLRFGILDFEWENRELVGLSRSGWLLDWDEIGLSDPLRPLVDAIDIQYNNEFDNAIIYDDWDEQTVYFSLSDGGNTSGTSYQMDVFDNNFDGEKYLMVANNRGHYSIEIGSNELYSNFEETNVLSSGDGRRFYGGGEITTYNGSRYAAYADNSDGGDNPSETNLYLRRYNTSWGVATPKKWTV